MDTRNIDIDALVEQNSKEQVGQVALDTPPLVAAALCLNAKPDTAEKILNGMIEIKIKQQSTWFEDLIKDVETKYLSDVDQKRHILSVVESKISESIQTINDLQKALYDYNRVKPYLPRNEAAEKCIEIANEQQRLHEKALGHLQKAHQHIMLYLVQHGPIAAV